MLRQVTWPPWPPDLNPVQMDSDELDHRVKAEGSISVDSFKTLGEPFDLM